MSKINSVSFRKSENEIHDYATKNYNFSEYVKGLIKKDYDKSMNIFTEDEKEEIRRIAKEVIEEK